MRIAILQKEKCKPTACGHECKKVCPVEKKELDSCVIIKAKASIDEKTCVGCAICEKRCPFDAIRIVNLPSVCEDNLIYRYGENGFALYGLPIPRLGSVLGLLGRNGIGKTTAVEILSGKKKINLGKDEVGNREVSNFLQGSELKRYFDELSNEKKKIAYKPQNLSALAVDVKVMDLLRKRGETEQIKTLAKKLGVENILENRMNKLSGGELQRVAIIAAVVGDADIYFLDEPLAFLDISERLRVSEFILELSKGKTVIVVEHDLLILDYLTDFLNIFYGQQGAFGAVSGVKSSREGVNAYLHGYLKEENLQIRDKELNFNFTKNKSISGCVIGEWPDFSVVFESGFKLDVRPGEIRQNHVIGILGKNGTGKTSFVKALAGELNTDRGKLNLGKLDISYKPQYLFSDSEDMVRDVMIKEKITKRFMSIFNLASIQQKKVKQLSGGELQRFSIARCLAKDADLYLIDEPSAYLDVEERISVAKAIKELMSEKEKTAFVVDHDLLLISYLADNIMVFSGEAGKQGKSSELLDFEDGISRLLKELDITLRKDRESGRPRINKRGSVLDREQKAEGKYAVF
ncbi:MAG: ribosome biogenesis/translation initiation ATPase RLI [archaeon]